MPKRPFGVISCYQEGPGSLPGYFSGCEVYVNVDAGGAFDSDHQHTRPNPGHSLANFMEWIIANYDSLPDRIAFVKSNVIPRHISESAFARKIKSGTFQQLWSQDGFRSNHFQESMLMGGEYLERNNSWYFRQTETVSLFRDFDSFSDFLIVPNRQRPKWLSFAPGACYLVTRENILRAPRAVFEFLQRVSSYRFFPKEAYAVERILQAIFTGDLEFHDRFLSQDWEAEFSMLEPKSWIYEDPLQLRIGGALEELGSKILGRASSST